MSKIASITLITVLISLFALNLQGLAQFKTSEKPWSKYPDNSGMEFIDVDSFYESLDKKQYVEFENAKLNIREKVSFKDINKVLSKADKYGKSRTGGEGYHPKRQVYVYITVSQDGKKMKTAVFDVEKQRPISASSN
ncbi:hypothetical protein [Neobacillus bataviensis]|uniref:hypothetical protein n=1 Tax=Neobacillus bataviensis TaxID=220685 RepID=UPI001CBD47BA|nr:hypothetical protein [Neobacillus bataviensis]